MDDKGGRSLMRVDECFESLAIATKTKVLARDYRPTGRFPVVDQGRERISGWTDDENAVIDSPLPLVVFGDHTRILKFVDFPFARGADGTQILKPHDDIDPVFFYYACRSIDLPSRGYNRHFSLLKEQQISIPNSKTEQVAFGRALRMVDGATAAQIELETVSQRLKIDTMRHLFTLGLRGEPQKDTEIGPVPESWDVVRIVDHASAISKGASPKWQGFNYVSRGVLFVRSQNVGNGVMDWRDKAYLPLEWNEKERRSILKCGDVLINLVGASIGRSAVGGHEIEAGNCNQAVCFIRLRQGEVHPAFLNGFFQAYAGQRQIHGSKKDIARANLSLEDVRQMLIPKPSLGEQNEIVSILDTIDRKIDLHRRKRALLEGVFKSLLQKLMTGDIRVSDLDLSALPAPAEATP